MKKVDADDAEAAEYRGGNIGNTKEYSATPEFRKKQRKGLYTWDKHPSEIKDKSVGLAAWRNIMNR